MEMANKSATGQLMGASVLGRAAQHDVYQRCVDILRCTARALCSSPGGLRFRAGSRPWLEGLGDSPRGKPALQTGG